MSLLSRPTCQCIVLSVSCLINCAHYHALLMINCLAPFHFLLFHCRERVKLHHTKLKPTTQSLPTLSQGQGYILLPCRSDLLTSNQSASKYSVVNNKHHSSYKIPSKWLPTRSLLLHALESAKVSRLNKDQIDKQTREDSQGIHCIQWHERGIS